MNAMCFLIGTSDYKTQHAVLSSAVPAWPYPVRRVIGVLDNPKVQACRRRFLTSFLTIIPNYLHTCLNITVSAASTPMLKQTASSKCYGRVYETMIALTLNHL